MKTTDLFEGKFQTHLKNLGAWEENEDYHHINVFFKEFSPLRNERIYINESLDFIQGYAPSDAKISLAITENLSYFAILNIQSKSGDYFSQQESLCIYDLMDQVTADIFDQLQEKKKSFFKFRFRKKPFKAA